MLDRQDLDALLVGALYGELTPAESERLAQHLESHPADKAALDDMTRARRAVQDSRIFASMAEPPQSVSALLLQEAHRRAPRAVRAPAPAEGWFQRFLKAFVAHPAMAAATMLVLVAGVAGTLYVKNGQLGAEEKVAMDKAPSVARSEADRGGAAGGEPATGSSAAFQAQLDDHVGDAATTPAAPVAPAPPADAEPTVLAKAAVEQQAQLRQNQLSVAHASRSSGIGGLVVHHPEPTVKELGDSDDREGADGTIAGGDLARRDAPAPAPATAASTSVSTKPSADVSNGPGAVTGGGGATAPTGQAAPRMAPPTQAPAASPPPPPPPAPVAAHEAEKKGEAAGDAKDASDNSLLAWAKQQHGQIVQLVQANNCDAAAKVAIQLQSRAPDYYDQNVATDRAVAPCNAYISEARARHRAAQPKPSNVNTSK
jgi:hypothetical protein